MEIKELNKVLEAHNHYLAQDCEAWKEMRANLSGAYLRGADLSGANLSSANLSGADLSGADLNGASLRKANLINANLRGANLRGANLSGANLSGADLNGASLRKANLINANLRGANLRGADLSGADLINAYLSGADLINANLSGADLRGANISGANLSSANLSGADLINADLINVKYNERTTFFALACPEEGDFIAWKKVNNVIVKLKVPSESRRSSATTRKCRCEFAEVLELQRLDGTPYNDNKVVNDNHAETIYKVGEIVRPDSWDDNRWNECSHGIHFFITRDEAVKYQQ